MCATTALRSEKTDPHCTATGAQSPLAGAPWRRFLVIGDQIATGRDESSRGHGGGSWADRVAAALRRVQPCLAYLNLGTRGKLVAEVRSRQLARALQFQPDLTALMCCGQELVRERFDADVVEAEFDRVVAALRENGGDVLMVNWFDVTRRGGSRPDEATRGLRLRLRELAERKQAVALRHGAIYVDLAARPRGAAPDGRGAHGADPAVREHAVAAASVVHGLRDHLAGGVPDDWR
ncbi:GDSL-type esterase/lipase family protein [Streptomyces sp. NPDC048182]|uniref:GDSL-type esterase/lipase family protein n=1 Tax=Streptomyces sp. NPDC048182 TaxID=3365507 RepID=UPI003718B8A5